MFSRFTADSRPPSGKEQWAAVNCAALAETLLESELFGHEKGAFTGAERRKEGCFIQAQGGTLLLDEVREMSRAMDDLLKYEWPGNVRELMNAVERAVVLCRRDYIDREEIALCARAPSQTGKTGFSRIEGGVASLDEVEKATILKTLEAVGGNKSETARRLGITRKTLHKKPKRYGVMK